MLEMIAASRRHGRRRTSRRTGRPVRMGAVIGAAIIGSAVLASCASSLKIRDILEDPARYSGRTVQVHGVVTKGGPVMSGAYELSDNTGSIMIITEKRGAPRRGTSLKISGTFRPAFQWGGDEVAAIVQSR